MLAKFAVYDNPAYFNDMHPVEWRGQVQSSTGGRRFLIRYYGSLYTWEVKPVEKHLLHHHKHYGKAFNGLICGTDEAPELIFAVDPESGEEILLFDGCRHGYDNLFCDTWTPEEVSRRAAAELYRDADGNELFEVVAYAFHNIDYDEEREEFEDAEGRISLLSGEIVDLPYLQRNGFDGFGIMLYSANGEKVKAHERELA